LRRAVRRLDAIVMKFIQRRREKREERDDLLTRLLDAQDEDGSRMTDQQLRDEVRTLFVAGHETTALTLSWTWYALAAHPEIDARLHEELRRELGDRPPTIDDVPRLRFTEQVVKEGLRLYPAAYAFGREPRVDVELGGWTIRRGQTALLSQWVTHRDL